MICPRCNNEVSSNYRNCPYCGQDLFEGREFKDIGYPERENARSQYQGSRNTNYSGNEGRNATYINTDGRRTNVVNTDSGKTTFVDPAHQSGSFKGMYDDSKRTYFIPYPPMQQGADRLENNNKNDVDFHMFSVAFAILLSMQFISLIAILIMLLKFYM